MQDLFFRGCYCCRCCSCRCYCCCCYAAAVIAAVAAMLLLLLWYRWLHWGADSSLLFRWLHCWANSQSNSVGDRESVVREIDVIPILDSYTHLITCALSQFYYHNVPREDGIICVRVYCTTTAMLDCRFVSFYYVREPEFTPPQCTTDWKFYVGTCVLHSWCRIA